MTNFLNGVKRRKHACTNRKTNRFKFFIFTVSFTINKFTWVIGKLRRDNLVQGFSPDFATHLPPTRHSKLKNIQGHEIVVVSLKENLLCF